MAGINAARNAGTSCPGTRVYGRLIAEAMQSLVETTTTGTRRM